MKATVANCIVARKAADKTIATFTAFQQKQKNPATFCLSVQLYALKVLKKTVGEGVRRGWILSWLIESCCRQLLGRGLRGGRGALVGLGRLGRGKVRETREETRKQIGWK